MRPRGPSRAEPTSRVGAAGASRRASPERTRHTDLAEAAKRLPYAAIREASGEPYMTLEALSPLYAERFRDQLGGLGQVVGSLWYAHGHERVQAVVAMLWPWLVPEMRDRARAVLGARSPAASHLHGRMVVEEA